MIYINNDVRDELRWFAVFEQLESLLAQVEMETDPAVRDQVTIVMKFKDFEAFISGIRRTLTNGYKTREM